MQVRGNYDEMEELRRQEESRQHRISRAKEELAEAEQALENLPMYEPPTDELVCKSLMLSYLLLFMSPAYYITLFCQILMH